MSISIASDDNFKSEVLDVKGKVIVDFFAPWCGPCNMLTPQLETFSKANPEVKVVKINIDDNPLVPTELGVRSIPTLALFKDGQHISTKVGMLNSAQIKSWIETES